jgi:hypothetical protein
MAVVADVEEIRIIRASAWVVSVLLVFRLTTTIATPALWNCPREVNSGSVVWTTRSVVTGPTADATRRFSGCGIRQSRKDREAGPDQDKRMSPPRTAVGRRFEINGAIQVHRRSTLASIIPRPVFDRDYSDRENPTISSTEIFLGAALMHISALVVSGIPRLSAEAVAVTRIDAVSRAPM